MRTCIEEFSRRPDHRTMASCVVCLLSHGVEGAIYGTDGQLLKVFSVWSFFRVYVYDVIHISFTQIPDM